MDSKNSTHRSTQASRASGQQVPPSVQAVLEFDYPKDVVLSIYQQLSTGSLDPSAQPGHEDPQGAAAGARIPIVTAALLMTSLDAFLARRQASGGDGSGLRSQKSGFFSEMVISGNRADSDVSEDGPGDQPGTSSSSSTQSAPPDDNPEHSHPAAQDRNTAQGTTVTSYPPTAQSLSLGSAAANTNVTAGDEASPVVSTTSNATWVRNEVVSASASSNPPVPLPAPTPASGSTPPHQPSPPQILTGASSTHSAPAAVGVAESRSTPAEDRTRERRRLLTRLRALREENRRLKARQMCRQCRQTPVNLTFLPCGHFIYCQACGSSFEECPACRKTILADVKTFLS